MEHVSAHIYERERKEKEKKYTQRYYGVLVRTPAISSACAVPIVAAHHAALLACMIVGKWSAGKEGGEGGQWV